MNIIVQGTKSFNDYSIFVRAMGVAMSDLEDGEDFNIYTIGPTNINRFTAEFHNVVEASMRARGRKIKFHRVPVTYVEENMEMFKWFGFFATPGEKLSHTFYEAQSTDMECAVFRY